MQSKILVISPAWIGDIVLSQALLRALKQRYSAALIDVLAPIAAHELLQRMPEVNQVHSMPIGHGQFQLKQRWQLGRLLAKQNYTQAYILPNSWKSALIPLFAGIPQRIGWLGECRWGLINQVHYLDKKKLPLMVDRFFALSKSPLHARTNPKLEVSSELQKTTIKKFNLAVTSQILALCPGAEYGSAKRWPARHYAALAQEKLALGWQVWLFGSKKDQQIAAEIQQHTQSQCRDLTGQTTLGEAVDLLALATMVVCNDSGLMHIAAALQRPLVAIYGSSSPRFTPPLAEKSRIVSLELSCSPCFKRECPLQHLKCLNDLGVNQVSNVIAEL